MKVGTPPFCRKTNSSGQWQQRQQRRRSQLDRRLAGNSAPNMACETNPSGCTGVKFGSRHSSKTKQFGQRIQPAGHRQKDESLDIQAPAKRAHGRSEQNASVINIYIMCIYIYILRSASRRSVVRVYKNVSLVQCLGMGLKPGVGWKQLRTRINLGTLVRSPLEQVRYRATKGYFRNERSSRGNSKKAYLILAPAISLRDGGAKCFFAAHSRVSRFFSFTSSPLRGAACPGVANKPICPNCTHRCQI